MSHQQHLINLHVHKNNTLNLRKREKSKTRSKIRLAVHKLPPDFFLLDQKNQTQEEYQCQQQGRVTPAFGQQIEQDKINVEFQMIRNDEFDQCKRRVQTLPIKQISKHYLSRQQTITKYSNQCKPKSHRVYSQFNKFQDTYKLIDKKEVKFKKRLNLQVVDDNNYMQKETERMRKHFLKFFTQENRQLNRKQKPKKLPPIL